MSYKYLKYPPGLGFPTEHERSLWEAKKARDRQMAEQMHRQTRERRVREQSLAPIGQEVKRKAEAAIAERQIGARRSAEQAVTAWYVEQVVTILARPGEYRPGVGGSAEAEWGLEATKRREWERAGFPMPIITSAPITRRPEYEQLDPWCIGLSHQEGVHIGLTDLVHKCITQLEIPTENVLAAVIYLRRLGFHDGDPRGRQLRSLLCQFHELHSLNVEKRVAILGLMLANKYVTDEPWANKSFASVVRIPTRELTALETAAVAEMHYSLMISDQQWLEYICELHEGFRMTFGHELVAHLVSLLRDSATGLQHSLHAVRIWHDSLAIAPPPSLAPIDFCGDVSLVSDILNVDEDEDDFVEYDGAKPFITKADLAIEDEDDYCEYDGAKPFITRADIRRNSSTLRSDASIADLRSHDQARAAKREARSREEPSKCDDDDDLDDVDAVLGVQVRPLPVPAMQPDWSVSVDMSRDTSFASQFGFWPDQIQCTQPIEDKQAMAASRWQQVPLVPARRHFYHRPWNAPARIRAPCFSY